MPKLALAEAKKVISTSKILLPLIYTRDKITIVWALETVRAADKVLHDRGTTETQKHAAAETLKKVNDALPATVAEAEALSVQAMGQLKKLTHKSKEGDRVAFTLAPRKLRREAARLVAKEEARLKKGTAEFYLAK